MGLFDSASNVGQFGANDSNIIRYKQAAEYAQDAKDYADLSGLIYEMIKSPDIQEQLSNLNITVEESAASAEAAKNSEMEAKEAAENAASDTTRIVNEQLEDQENRFTYFLNSSGYSFLGDYENGPFLFSERNQYIRYDNQYCRLNVATDVGFTTTGTDAVSFANDVTHFVLIDWDTLRQELDSREGDAIVAAEKVRGPFGGTLAQTIRYISVDAFGADPTGATDSTAAVLAAVQSAKAVADSAFVTGDTTYFKVVFGKGIYMLGDVPMYSGIHYEGQGAGTLIKPLPGAQYCFTTTGTKPYGRTNLKRMFYASITNMHIGCSYYETLFAIPAGVGGINIEYASYIRIENVELRRLSGVGLNLSEVWDSDFNSIRMTYVGNATDTENPVPALRMSMGGGKDGCNAVRFYGLHIEACPKSMELGIGCRHVFFNSPKIEDAVASVSSTITGAGGVVFNAAELTWSSNTSPMFLINRTASFESFGVTFNSPVCLSGGSSRRGWYFNHTSPAGIMSIDNPICKNIKTLITGLNYTIDGGTSYACGPQFIKGTGNAIVRNHFANAIQSTSTAGAAATDGTDDYVIMTGRANRIRNCHFNSYGSVSDGLAYINITGANPDTACQSNTWSGARQYGVRNPFGTSLLRDNYTVDGGSIGSILSNDMPKYTLNNTSTSGLGVGGISSASVTVGERASGSLRIVAGGSLILLRTSSVLGPASAVVFVDANSNEVALLASTKGVFATGAGTYGDGKVYISKTGVNLVLTNYSTTSAVFYGTAFSANA